MRRAWTINGRFLTQPVTGVQRYAIEIVSALDRALADNRALARDVTLELLTPPGAAALPGLSAISVRAVGTNTGHLWEQMTLPRFTRGRLLSLCNTGPVALGQQVVCIHDANTRTHPQSYSPAFRSLYGMLLPALGHRARAITTVSRHAAGQLAAFGIAPASKITVIPNGHEHALTWTARHTADTRAVSGRSTIVILGSPAPHKNVAMLLGLAPRLDELGFRLAIVGARDGRVFQGLDGAAAASPNVTWLGRVADAALAALLEDSLCLAFPSFAEGFGLPPLEAMARGCAVVSSDAASLPEVCGAAALYADPNDPDAWIARLSELRQSPALRQQLVVSGRAQAARFSWQQGAESYLALMQAMDVEQRVAA